jgi:hypothetical protein
VPRTSWSKAGDIVVKECSCKITTLLWVTILIFIFLLFSLTVQIVQFFVWIRLAHAQVA